MFSIIDVETTGGTHATSRITEIAIVCHDGQQVVEKFESLINPQCWIPSFITDLTGISNEMVRDAPTFEQVADDIRRLTKNTAFVAHNAAFDYGFVKREFGRLDEHFERDTFCTVRLSRKIFPGFPTYSLGPLCKSLKINHVNHHRAMGDAAATTQLFELLLKNDSNGLLKAWVDG